MRLYLDDERPTPDGWMRAFTAAEAISLLEAGAVEEISLDHDLGPPEAGTGYDVASWIEEQAAFGKLAPLAWRVHSANPVGRARMEAAMNGAERFWSRQSNNVSMSPCSRVTLVSGAWRSSGAAPTRSDAPFLRHGP